MTTGKLFLVAAMAVGLTGLAFAQDQAGPKVGDDFVPLDVDNWLVGGEATEAVDAEDLKGKVFVVEFWGTWCPPCRAVIPHMKELYKKYEESGNLVVMAVHTKKGGDPETVKKFVSEQGMNYHIAIDKGTTLQSYGVRGVPHALVFGPDGKLVWRGHPGNKEFDQAVENELAKLAENKP